jgi:hypothetical protein
MVVHRSPPFPTTQGQRHQPRSYRKPRRERDSSWSTTMLLSCYWLMLSCAVVTCTIWASVGGHLSGRHPCSTRHRCRHRLPGGPRGTAPSAQLLPFPLRPDLRRHARTPRARAAVRVAAARARHAGAGPHAGRGQHTRRHGAAASPGGGWGGVRKGGGRARRGSSRVRFLEGLRHALEEPLHICGSDSTSPPCNSAGRWLHVGWYRSSARPSYSGCYLGSSRHSGRHRDYQPSLQLR